MKEKEKKVEENLKGVTFPNEPKQTKEKEKEKKRKEKGKKRKEKKREKNKKRRES